MKQRQRGVALITAILIVALATIAAAALLSDADVALRRAQTLQDSELAWWYAKGLDSWVASLLQRNNSGDPAQQPVDSLGDQWAQPVSFLPFEHGAGRGRVTDMQGLFNLNNLASPGSASYLAQFARLVESVSSAASATDLGNSIRQWLLPANSAQAIGLAPTADYAGLNPPYQASGQAMYSPSEVLPVSGMTPQLYTALAPYITAIPPTQPTSTAAATGTAATAAAAGGGLAATALNVNTAPLQVLLSLSEHPNAGQMKAFVAERVEQPARTVQEATQRLGLSATDTPAGVLSVSSNYYLLQADIAVGTDQMALYSVILRPTTGAPVVIARSTTTD